jgi:uncharacterized membrane protein (Fun14 family)
MYESLLPFATSIGGGFFIGILLGYFLKKIIKILMFVTGGLVGLLLYLEQQKILSIDIERLQVTSSFIFTSVASSFDNMTQIDGLTSLGIPLTASMTAGFTVGFMKA